MRPESPPGASGPAVALVSMPFGPVVHPSMGLGLLQAVLKRDGLPCRSFYLNLDFAEEIGTRAYHLGLHLGPASFQIGDWAFAEAAFGAEAPPAELYLGCLERAWSRSPRGGGPGGASARARDLLDTLRRLREAAPDFVERAAEEVLAWKPRIVGCTTSLDQTVASLALLRALRRRAPEVITMLGGAHCETRMGLALHRNFPWVDYVVSGEAEGLLPGLCRAVGQQGRSVPTSRLPAGVLGPEHRRTGHPAELPRATERNLDALPDPDFDDYFSRLAGSPLRAVVLPGIPVEASRGCWWGQKHPCTFCGFNGSSLAYRSRDPEALLEALERQVRRYGVRRLFLVDNILDHSYRHTVLPRLAQRPERLQLFCEVKANLDRQDLEGLKQAGMDWIQPGIESLHSQHLRLMDKGVQAWQSLSVLRMARELGLRVSWLLLWGFPGEEDGWFADMARFVPRLEHLQPPLSLLRIRFDRYSVYQRRPEDFGLHLEPGGALHRIFPVPDRELADLAYAFRDREDPDFFGDGPPTGRRGFRQMASRPGVRALAEAVARWNRAHLGGLRPLLHVEDDGEALAFLDTRRVASETRFRLEGAERDVYRACESTPRREALPARTQLGPETAEAALAGLLRRGVALEVDGHVLPLALRGAVPALPGREDYPGGHLLRDLPPSRRPVPERV